MTWSTTGSPADPIWTDVIQSFISQWPDTSSFSTSAPQDSTMSWWWSNMEHVIYCESDGTDLINSVVGTSSVSSIIESGGSYVVRGETSWRPTTGLSRMSYAPSSSSITCCTIYAIIEPHYIPAADNSSDYIFEIHDTGSGATNQQSESKASIADDEMTAADDTYMESHTPTGSGFTGWIVDDLVSQWIKSNKCVIKTGHPGQKESLHCSSNQTHDGFEYWFDLDPSGQATYGSTLGILFRAERGASFLGTDGKAFDFRISNFTDQGSPNTCQITCYRLYNDDNPGIKWHNLGGGSFSNLTFSYTGERVGVTVNGSVATCWREDYGTGGSRQTYFEISLTSDDGGNPLDNDSSNDSDYNTVDNAKFGWTCSSIDAIGISIDNVVLNSHTASQVSGSAMSIVAGLRYQNTFNEADKNDFSLDIGGVNGGNPVNVSAVSYIARYPIAVATTFDSTSTGVWHTQSVATWDPASRVWSSALTRQAFASARTWGSGMTIDRVNLFRPEASGRSHFDGYSYLMAWKPAVESLASITAWVTNPLIPLYNPLSPTVASKGVHPWSHWNTIADATGGTDFQLKVLPKSHPGYNTITDDAVRAPVLADPDELRTP